MTSQDKYHGRKGKLYIFVLLMSLFSCFFNKRSTLSFCPGPHKLGSWSCPLLANFVTLGKLFKQSMPQFSFLQHGNNSHTCFIVLLRGLDMPVKQDSQNRVQLLHKYLMSLSLLLCCYYQIYSGIVSSHKNDVRSTCTTRE